MNKRLLDWLQVLGNLGLLVGIVLVAVQLQQNAQLMKAQLAHDSWLHASDQFMTHLGEEPAKVLAKLADGDLDLSNEELIAANSLFTTMLIAIARVEYTNNAGLDLYEPEMTARIYAPNFVEGFGQIWWELNHDQAAAVAPNITKEIDRILASGEGASELKYFGSLKQAVDQAKDT